MHAHTKETSTYRQPTHTLLLQTHRGPNSSTTKLQHIANPHIQCATPAAKEEEAEDERTRTQTHTHTEKRQQFSSLPASHMYQGMRQAANYTIHPYLQSARHDPPATSSSEATAITHTPTHTPQHTHTHTHASKPPPSEKNSTNTCTSVSITSQDQRIHASMCPHMRHTNVNK